MAVRSPPPRTTRVTSSEATAAARRRPGERRRCAGSTRRSSSENREEPVDLPGRDLDAVLLPLLALGLDEALEGVLAEGAQHQLGLGRDLDRLAERLRQLVDAALVALL